MAENMSENKTENKAAQPAPAKRQRRRMAPRAVVLLAVIAFLLLMLVVSILRSNLRNNGRRYATKLGEQVGMSVGAAQDAARIELLTASESAVVSQVGAGYPYVYESPKTTTVAGVEVPQWVIFCAASNDTVTQVVYYDYRQLGRNGHGTRSRSHIELSGITTGMTPATVQGFVGSLPLRRLYAAGQGLQETYKYNYPAEDGSTVECLLYVTYDTEGHASAAAETTRTAGSELLTVP
ncbi:MAG: hypothetical protein IKI21_06695 [Oscillospiraceae bacterium]|nr:hypothetical protein [Oscillospiraceae bacterium]